MPNIKSAKKRMNLSAAARTANRSERSRIRTAIKRVRAAENTEDSQARMKEAVVAHLGEAPRQDMLKEPGHEYQRRQRHSLPELGFHRLVTEGDPVIFHRDHGLV